VGWVAAAADRVVGCVGLELHPPAALLRSLAVVPERRGRRVGSSLLARALLEARRRGAREVYLLTTGAADYFARYGFRPVPRAQAEPAVGHSAEFKGLCPASAVVMRLDLETPPTSLTFF